MSGKAAMLLPFPNANHATCNLPAAADADPLPKTGPETSVQPTAGLLKSYSNLDFQPISGMISLRISQSINHDTKTWTKKKKFCTQTTGQAFYGSAIINL